MANRRLGGMGGPQRGNRSFSQHQPFQGNNVSPWQGNMPSNNSMNQSGLIGQLAANPQQLAVALSSFLQNQQQQMNNPPSLLSLNTSPAFSRQDNRDSFNRFGNRGRTDFRRNEPYNKNRNSGGGLGGGWRQLDSNKNSGQIRNKPGNFGQKDNRKFSPVKPRLSKDDKPLKEENADTSQEEIRDEEGAEEVKREWKDEKKTDDKKEDDAQEEGDDEKKDEQRDLDGNYYGVPQKFLHCFVCNKDMWDGESFQKHVRGRAHKQMLTSLEESFHITVNILRENMRLVEEKKAIEINRMQRLSKNKFNRKFQEPESHCNMCDLKFLGKIISHRKTEGHQRLKRFLHPNCNICAKEFPSRMDWVDHRLTPEHLRQLNETFEGKAGGEDGEIIDADASEVDLEPLLEESMQMEEDNPILELTDDLNNIQNRIPAYKRNRGVSTQSLKEFSGFMCDICHRSFENKDFAEAHLKTEAHYYTFVDAVKQKYKKQSEEAAKEAEEKKRKREEEENAQKEGATEEAQNGNDGEMYDPEEACNEEENTLKVEAEEAEAEQEEETPPAVVDDAKETVEEQVAEEPQQQSQQQKNTNSPRTTRRSTGGIVGGGAVKNGAGPKSKKLATTNEETSVEPNEKSTAAISTFRIPKVTGSVKNGASPKSKKARLEN